MVLRSGFAEAVCTLLGIYIVFCSAVHLFNSTSIPSYKRGKAWVFDVFLSILLILFGLWLIVYPLWPSVLVGVTLIAFGLELIGQASSLRKRDGKSDSEKQVYYTDDFEDKSDEL